jgi:Flp pilus assembly protein TadB
VTWLLAVIVVLACWFLILALTAPPEPLVMDALGIRPAPRSERGRWFRDRRVLLCCGVGIGMFTATVDLPTAAVAAPVLGLAGYRLPALQVARAATRRRLELDRAVPDVLDLVAVSVTAGLSPRLALERAAGVVSGPMGTELMTIRNEVALGATWPSGLRAAAGRSGVQDLRRLAMVLDRSHRLGVPVADRLRELAREVRADRRSRREERARRAPVAMLFPLVFLILPAFVVAAVVPAVLVAVRGAP